MSIFAIDSVLYHLKKDQQETERNRTTIGVPHQRSTRCRPPRREHKQTILLTNQELRVAPVRTLFRINELLALVLLPLNTANIHYESKMSEGSRMAWIIVTLAGSKVTWR